MHYLNIYVNCYNVKVTCEARSVKLASLSASLFIKIMLYLGCLKIIPFFLGNLFSLPTLLGMMHLEFASPAEVKSSPSIWLYMFFCKFYYVSIIYQSSNFPVGTNVQHFIQHVGSFTGTIIQHFQQHKTFNILLKYGI